jgi:hypothetical protein
VSRHPGYLAALVAVAEALDELGDEVVFVGGAVLGLLLNDPGAAPPRITDDVDLIVELSSRFEYHQFADRLRSLGFSEDASPGAPICRWLLGKLKVDVMPTEPTVLGFSNRWYPDAVQHCMTITPENGPGLRCVDATYFLATKFEAFLGRGHGDFQASADLEDIVALVDGRTNLVDEIAHARDDVRQYLKEKAGGLLGNDDFLATLPGHVPGDVASQTRIPAILARLQEIAGLPD